MSDSLLMLDLVSVVYWFDERLQQALAARGWGTLNRSQSLVLANVANGETRSARIAEKMGVSRQALSRCRCPAAPSTSNPARNRA